MVEPGKVSIPGAHQKVYRFFEIFKCPFSIDLLLFSQLSLYHYFEVKPAVVKEIYEESSVYSEVVTMNTGGNIISLKMPKFYC